MQEHLKKSAAEFNQLLTEYWKLRDETGKYSAVLDLTALLTLCRCVHGDPCKRSWHASA